MKSFISRIVRSGKLGIIEFVISMLGIAASILLLVLDFNGIISLTVENFICISIVLLGILVTSSLIERFGILSFILENLVSPNENRAYLTIRDQYNQAHSVENYYSDITEMCVMAVANTSFLRGNGLTTLKKAAQKTSKLNYYQLIPIRI